MTGKLTVIRDREGQPLAQALVPASWLTGGEKFHKADGTFLAAARAVDPEGSATMFVQTGEEFLEVIKGAGLDQKHEEDKVDPYFGMTMRRYLLKNDYLDKIAQALTGGAGPELIAETDIPLIGGGSAEAFEQAVRERAAQLERWLESGGEENGTQESGKIDRAYWDLSVRHLITAHPIRQYSFKKDGNDRILIIAADLFAFDFDLAGSGTGALSGLPGGLFGKGTGSYIIWGSNSLAAVITDETCKAEARRAFYRYAAAFSWLEI